MTQITSPTGEVLDTRPPHQLPKGRTYLDHVDTRFDIKVIRGGTVLAHVDIGPVCIYGNGDTQADRLAHLAAIGRAITAQAEALLADPLDRLTAEAAS